MKLLLTICALLCWLGGSAQAVIEEYLEQGTNVIIDTVLFPKALLKTAKIKRITKSNYNINDKGNISKKKQGEEIWEFTPSGLIEFYAHRSKYKDLTYAITAKYDSNDHAIEYYDCRTSGYDIRNYEKAMFTQRMPTDSGMLVQTTVRYKYDSSTRPYTFLINEKDNIKKVYYYEDEEGYYRIKSDSVTYYVNFDHHGTLDTIKKMTYTRVLEQDSIIRESTWGDYVQVCAGEVFPWNHIDWYDKRHKHLLKRQVHEWYMIYYDEWGNPVEVRRLDTDSHYASSRLWYKTKYRFNFRLYRFLPYEKLSFSTGIKGGFYYDKPTELSRYEYEFYD